MILLDAGTDSLYPIIGYAIAVLLSIIITRAIFSIGVIVRNLKAQTKLLGHIAEKQGIDYDVVQKVLYEAKDQIYQKKKVIAK